MNNRDQKMSALKKFSIVVATVSLLPILLVPQEMWDSVEVSLAGSTGNLISWKHGAISLGWNLLFTLQLWQMKLCQAIGVSYKPVMNIIAVLLLVGIAYETFKFLKNQCGLSEKAAYFGAWITLAFPLWHIFVISGLQVRLICMWLFMVAVNLWPRNKWLATLVLIPSLQFFSLFSLAVGVLWANVVLQADRDTYVRKSLGAIVYSACLLAGFIVLSKMISIHGDSGKYNTFNPQHLVQFVDFAIAGCVALAVWIGIAKYLQDKQESLQLLRRLLVFLLLFFFASLPYWAVGRPLRFFSFGSFGGRHAMLTYLAIAVVAASLTEVGLAHFKQKYIYGAMAFVLTASIVLLYQGYDHKVAALLFRNMLTYSFEQVERPASGYVSIRAVGYEAPRHVHNSAVELSMYRAYGSLAWVTNGFWAKRGYVWDKKDIIQCYAPKPGNKYPSPLASEMTGEAYTAYNFILENYHQEGRIWYWLYYLTKDYSVFNPHLVRIE